MSVKDVRDYEAKLYEEYRQVLLILAEIDAESERKLISPEEVKRIKSNYAPIINSYKELAFFIYLLNMPNKKDKKKKFKKQNLKVFEDNDFVDEKVIAQNESIIKSYKEKKED